MLNIWKTRLLLFVQFLDNIEKYENALSAKNKMKDLAKSLNEAKIAFPQSKKDFMVVFNISKSEIDRLETFEERSEEKTKKYYEISYRSSH